MRVLLSIKPVHVANIRSGVKTFEFRRRLFARRDVRTVLIYCTQPVGRLVGEFDIADILEDEPEALWASTAEGSGISKDFFDAYFKDRLRAFALQIGSLRLYSKPLCPSEMFDNFTPPQSYMYVPGHGTSRVAPRQLALL
jgi:predicted transcriptional regulator